MDIQDILFNNNFDDSLRQSFFQFMIEENITDSHIPILKSSQTNDDVNGSQHVSHGGSDFTYVDADEDDVESATTLGYYEYFSEYGANYTGHYYQGSERKFAAIVVDPPAYAATFSL